MIQLFGAGICASAVCVCRYVCGYVYPISLYRWMIGRCSSHLAELGKLGVIQFTDLNPELTPFQRRYVSYVKRCDELERKLRFFNAGIEKTEFPFEFITTFHITDIPTLERCQLRI
mmetsp:Transcript_33638/g.37818  ORF Transcript_33638/g.37818 Transcript_33638/m.37818 type:complete len:116 (+) Transcript_33638:507-854(+)